MFLTRMSFLRRLPFVPGLPGRDDDSDEEGEGAALLEHEDYSSSESESSSASDQEERMDNGGETLQTYNIILLYILVHSRYKNLIL